MTIAESRRLALFELAKTSWGEDTAQTLMDYLPFDPDAHATKADLAVMGAELRAESASQTRTLMLAMLTIEVTIVLAVVGALVALVARA